MYTVVINQPAGLGDIFICQKIGYCCKTARNLENNNRVIWPVLPQFLYLKDYLFSSVHGTIEYVSIDSDFPLKEAVNNRVDHIAIYEDKIFIPLHGHPTCDESVLRSKFKFTGVKVDGWQDYFNFVRNREREERLWNHLNLSHKEPYIFVNRNFASPPNIQRISIPDLPKDIRVVEMEFFGWDNIFDWCKVLEHAVEIHTVNTSICYLLEKLTTTDKLFMYERTGWPGFDYVYGFLKQPWRFMYNES